MKSPACQTIGILLFSLMLASCTGETKKNPYLGRIPSIEKKYYDQILELVEGVDNSGDISNTITMMGAFDRVESEWEQAINQEVRITDLTKPIPVEYPKGLPFSVKEARVEHLSRGNLVLQFRIQAVDTIPDSRALIMIFEALDKKGAAAPEYDFGSQQFRPGRPPAWYGMDLDGILGNGSHRAFGGP